MPDKECITNKRLENLMFTVRLYEMHADKMPSDRLLSQLCEMYRKKYVELLERCCEGEEVPYKTYEIAGESNDRIQNKPF